MTPLLANLGAVTGKGRRVSHSVEHDQEPVPAEELVGKDELDEDDEMVLSADDLVEGISGTVN